MKKTREPEDLLERLCSLTNCFYLSDLHSNTNIEPATMVSAVRQLQTEAFSLSEWTDAVNYITNERHDFSSIECAAAFLEQYAQRDNP